MLQRGKQTSQGEARWTSLGTEVLRGMAFLIPTDSSALSRPSERRMQNSLEVNG